MGIISAIVIGFIIGILARLLMPGKDPAGFIVTTLLGIAGALVASLVGRAMGMYREGEPAGFVFSVIGAMLLLFVYGLMTGRRAAVR